MLNLAVKSDLRRNFIFAIVSEDPEAWKRVLQAQKHCQIPFFHSFKTTMSIKRFFYCHQKWGMHNFLEIEPEKLINCNA